MKIARTLAKIGRDATFDLFAVHKMALVINIQYDPNMTGYGQLFTNGRGQTHGAQLLGFAAYGVFLTLYKYTVEFEGVDHTLSSKSNDQTTLFCLLDMVCLDQVLEKNFVVILGNPMEVVEP